MYLPNKTIRQTIPNPLELPQCPMKEILSQDPFHLMFIQILHIEHHLLQLASLNHLQVGDQTNMERILDQTNLMEDLTNMEIKIMDNLHMVISMELNIMGLSNMDLVMDNPNKDMDILSLVILQ